MTRQHKLLFLASLSFSFSSLPCLAENISGQVVDVLDGDTIEVLHNNRAERIRLNGIDCPEKGQAFGHKAKLATSALVFRKEGTHARTNR